MNVCSQEIVDSKLKNVGSWAPQLTPQLTTPQLTESQENYPNYWSLKGWKCFVSR